MAIDGIGKPPAPPTVGPSGASGVEPRKVETFAVGQPAAPAPASGLSPALEAVQRGELSLDQYLDQRIDQAVSHLANRIAPAELEFVKRSLREQLQTDPVLVELVQRTTAGLSTKSQ